MLNHQNDLLHKLSDHLKKNNKLEKLSQKFINDYQLLPTFGVEIEFYLSKEIDITQFEKAIQHKIKSEKGCGQYEIDLLPSAELANYANEINQLKINVIEVAEKLGGKAYLTAKPFLNDYGNSQHFHVDFKNLNSSGFEIDNFLEQAAYSLCYYMLDNFIIFMPQQEDYARIDKKFMTPTNVSFGGNNRSTAIRIPDSFPKRLEHRVSSVSADPYLVMVTILNSILLGKQYPETIPKYPKIYGNAFDEHYKLIPFPSSFKEALRSFKQNFFEKNK